MISVLIYHTAICQSCIGFEQYYYTGERTGPALVSRIYGQNDRQWYGELRYNYEGKQTGSLYAGKKFSKDDDLSYSFTPIAGLVMGKLKGGSAGINIALNGKHIYFSSVSQYTVSSDDRRSNFFFNWAELGYQLSERLYAGLALQQTCPYKTSIKWETGIQMGFSFKHFTIPFYSFSPWSDKRYFVLGVSAEWKH